MAFTVEPASVDNINIIDTSETNKDLGHYGVRYNEKFAVSTVVEKIIVFDPRRDKDLQINAKGNTYDIDVTTHAGDGNDDILSGAVPWVSLKSAITADFSSGGGEINKGILAVRITAASTSFADFEINASQYGADLPKYR